MTDTPHDAAQAGPIRANARYRDVNVVDYHVGLGGPLIEFRWTDVNDAPQSCQLSGPDVLCMAESHADLVAALEVCLMVVENWYDQRHPFPLPSDRTLEIAARAALAKAKGGAA